MIIIMLTLALDSTSQLLMRAIAPLKRMVGWGDMSSARWDWTMDGVMMIPSRRAKAFAKVRYD
jgi:hypothetical protein